LNNNFRNILKVFRNIERAPRPIERLIEIFDPDHAAHDASDALAVPKTETAETI
jgi:hypothetical protein